MMWIFKNPKLCAEFVINVSSKKRSIDLDCETKIWSANGENGIDGSCDDTHHVAESDFVWNHGRNALEIRILD